MHSQALTEKINALHARWREEHPLFAQLRAGTFDNAKAVKYLQSTFYVISHTQPHLRRAEEISLQRNMPELARFFREKASEEEGHDEWVKSDLRESGREYNPEEVASTSRELVEFLNETIDTDPTLYLSYILFIEYFTVIAGPELVELFESCGLSRAQFSVIDLHAELDKEHIKDDFECIDKLVPTSYTTNDLMAVVNKSFNYYDTFFHEIIA